MRRGVNWSPSDGRCDDRLRLAAGVRALFGESGPSDEYGRNDNVAWRTNERVYESGASEGETD